MFQNKRKLKWFAEHVECVVESKLSNFVYWGLLSPNQGIFPFQGYLNNPLNSKTIGPIWKAYLLIQNLFHLARRKNWT